MAGFTAGVQISRTPDEVWRWITGERDVKAWNPAILEFEKLTPGPVGLGTKFKETRLCGKRKQTAVVEVTESEEGILHAGTVKMAGITGTYRYWLEPADGGTHVRLEAEVKGNFFMKLFVPMIVKGMKKQDGDQLERLKKAIEASSRA